MSLARRIRPLAALGAALMLTNPAGAYTITRCAAGGEAAIDRLQIDRAKISKIITDRQVTGGETLYVTGYLLWLKSNACHGSLVLHLAPDCGFLDSFARGDCTLASFKK